jgi:hypothetical protein
MRAFLISWVVLVSACGRGDAPTVDADSEEPLRDGGTAGADASGDAGSQAADAGPGPVDAGSDPVDAGDPCGPNGVFDINHCDCDPGYREVRLRCEAIPACMADAFEPNNTLATASRPDGGVFGGQICAGDVDAVLVDAPMGVRLEATLTFRHDEGDLNLALYEPGRDPRFASPIARADSRDDDETLTHQTRRAGDFLVVVSGRFGTEQAPYQLQITLVP